GGALRLGSEDPAYAAPLGVVVDRGAGRVRVHVADVARREPGVREARSHRARDALAARLGRGLVPGVAREAVATHEPPRRSRSYRRAREHHEARALAEGGAAGRAEGRALLDREHAQAVEAREHLGGEP